MAPGCEPLAVGRMMAALRPHVYGQCLAGAGGGGFLYALTKAPRQKEALHQILANTEVRCELPGQFAAAASLQPLTLHSASTRSVSPPHEGVEVACCPLTLPQGLGGENRFLAGSSPN